MIVCRHARASRKLFVQVRAGDWPNRRCARCCMLVVVVRRREAKKHILFFQTYRLEHYLHLDCTQYIWWRRIVMRRGCIVRVD